MVMFELLLKMDKAACIFNVCSDQKLWILLH